MNLPLLDLELARRVEFAESQASCEAAETVQRLRPAVGAAVERIAGGAAVFCGVNSPVTQATGVGLNGPVSAHEIDRLEQFYFSRGDAARVELCPLAHASVTEEFGKRGYRVTEFSNVMARPIRRDEKWPAPHETIQIERLAPAQADLWARVVAQGFAEQYPVTPEIFDVMEMFALGRNTECYLARVKGEPAGGAALAIRKGIAGCFGASTLPAFRNRGVQTALLNVRLARAVATGCELAVSIAQPGSTSQRNITRQGFLTLYTRVKFEKALPAA